MGKRHSSTTFETARAAWLDDARFRRLSPVTIREYGRVSGVLLAHLADTLAIDALRLSEADHAAIAAALPPPPPGDVYALERDRHGPHGRIMKYNLNTA